MMQMALDTSGAWEPGDDLRLIEALGSGFSEYILKGIGVCMNDVERISAGAVPRIRLHYWTGMRQAKLLR
jgi:hypothetical protein